MRKKALFLSISTLLFILLLEFISFITLLIQGQNKLNYEQIYNNKSEYILGQEQGQSFHTEIFRNHRYMHPYFGFYIRKTNLRFEKNDINGFSGDIKTPILKKENEFIVGILGGSVADNFASYLLKNKNEFIKIIKEKVPKAQNKNIKILNFSFPGGKQPQQYLISTFYAENLDMTINVEGLNEMFSSYPMFPWSFPDGGEHYINHPIVSDLKEEITNLRALSHYFDSFQSLPLINYSQIYHLVWKSINLKIKNQILEIFEKFKSLPFWEEKYKKNHFFDPNKTREEVALETHLKFTNKQNKILKSFNVLPIFILHPNLAITDSKSMSEKEKNEFFEKNEYIDSYYQKAGKVFNELNIDNNFYFDFRYIFKDTKETTYRDKCCHLNELGNKIMLEQLLTKIDKHL